MKECYGENGKPKHIQEARYRDDREALSAMGKKGNAVQAENRRLRKEAEEEAKKKRTEEAALKQARELSLSPEGDVLPPDPNIVASLED